jgi:hypothetical protein
MRLYARNEYGLSEFDYPVFSDRSMESYKRLVLKPIMSSWTGSGVEDYFANQLVKKVDVDRVAARPVEVFLNGEYWGVYTLQERIDARYIEANTGIPRDEVDMIDHWSGLQVSAGDNEDFLDLYAFIEDNDLTIPANYDAVKERIDLNSFIDYQLFEIYIGNYDWPSNNMKCYRAKQSDAKWRWIFFDGDASLNGADFDAIQHAFSESTTSWNTGAYSTLFLRKLHENDEFRDLFYQRLEQLLKVDFQQNQTEQIMDNTTELISHKMPFYHSRFYDLNNTPDWNEKMENHYLFLEERACSLAYFAKVNHDENILVSECPEVHLKIEGVQIQPTPNYGSFYLTLESDKKTHGNIKIYNLLGALVHEEPHIEVNIGNNYHLITLPNAPAGVLYIHFMMDNKVYKVKTLVL